MASRSMKRPSSRVCERNTSPVRVDRSSSGSLTRRVPRARKQTTLNGTGATRSNRSLLSTQPANSRASRMCSASALAQAFGAEVAQDHPQLQRAEPAAELDAGVHQVPHAASASVVFRYSGVSANACRSTSMRRQYRTLRSNGVNSHLCGLTTTESAASAPAQDPLVARHHRGDARVGGVDVQPDLRRARRSRRSRRTGSTLVRRRACRRWRRPPSAGAQPRDPSSIACASARGACGTRRRRIAYAASRDRGRAGSPPCRPTSARARSSRRAARGRSERPASPCARTSATAPPRARRRARAASRSTPCRR